MWIPPKSKYDLIQEQFYHDPWKLLVACIFCNQTRRFQAEKIMWKFFEKYSTPHMCACAKERDLVDLLKPIGFKTRRAKTLIRFSKEFLLKNWIEPIELYGIGRYANDAWHIFCVGDWKKISRPNDHALSNYYDFLMIRKEDA